MRAAIAVVALSAASARADDASSLHERGPALLHATSDELLHLAPVSIPFTAGLGARIEREHAGIDLGEHGWVELEGTRWTNELDVPARGGAIGIRVGYDIGWLHLSAGLELGNVDNRYSSGSYYDVGISIGTSKRLSRWTTAWLALSVGRRVWRGVEPPPGEHDVFQVMLTLGFTFR